jgi:predicted nucleic acid-binding protein
LRPFFRLSILNFFNGIYMPSDPYSDVWSGKLQRHGKKSGYGHFALWNEEEGASTVDTILRDKPGHRKIYVSFMTFMECRYRLRKDQGRDAADEIFRALSLLPLIRVDVDDALLLTASELKAQHNVSVADSWILATAILCNATLVHKDPEFDALSNRVVMKRLPYKKSRGHPRFSCFTESFQRFIPALRVPMGEIGWISAWTATL